MQENFSIDFMERFAEVYEKSSLSRPVYEAIVWDDIQIRVIVWSFDYRYLCTSIFNRPQSLVRILSREKPRLTFFRWGVEIRSDLPTNKTGSFGSEFVNFTRLRGR